MKFREREEEKKIQWIKSFELDMYRVAKGILENEEDCKDALQETIIRAYRNIDKLKNEEYAKTWLIRITINESNRIYAQRKKIRNMFLSNSFDKQDLNREDALDLHTSIEKLPPKYKITILLYYFGNCTYKEISKILRVPQGTVKSRLNKAKELLKKELGGWL